MVGVKLIAVGLLTVTSYRAVPVQTKPSCKSNSECQTSIGENVSELGCAVSQDLLASGQIHYHDVLYISGLGFRIVNDTMASRIRSSVDVFVYTKKEEKRFGVRHLQVYREELIK